MSSQTGTRASGSFRSGPSLGLCNRSSLDQNAGAEANRLRAKNFFAELKRRNVYKVAVAYIVVGWLLIQIATQVFPFFDIPNWAVRFVVIVILLGLPIALVLAWAFEMTPEGMKRTENISPDEQLPQWSRPKFAAFIGATALLATGLLAFQWLRPGTTNQPAALPPAALPAIPDKSIAVLPFANLSSEKENAYFSEGIQEEILTRLAKIAELKVISRISTQSLGSSRPNVHQLARELGAVNILEGSVQKIGSRVRVNVQLVDAVTDAHLWADTYDRDLTDIFAVESEIARTVAQTLQARLTGVAEQVLASRPTQNPDAHQLYLKGRFFWNQRDAPNLQKAIGFFQQAINLDPTYALAYVGLADSYALVPIYSRSIPSQNIPKALAAAHRALELDDTLAEAHTSLANALVMDLQMRAAEPEFRKAIALNPNYATTHQWYGECLQALGRSDEALAELRRAHELDPLSLIINSVFGSALSTAGHQMEAIGQLQRTLEMDPTFGPAQFMLGQVFEEEGDLQKATAAYEKARDLNPSTIRLAMVARLYALTGRTSEARKIFDDLTNLSRREYVQAYPLAILNLTFGNKEEALRLIEKSYDERGLFLQGNACSLKIDKRLDPLRDDPRFQKLVAKFMGESQ